MTVAAGIQIQGAGQAGPTQGPAQSRMPGAESFRASWQDQLASLSGEAEGRNANAALGTGVPAVRLGGAKGLEAGSAKGAGRQPGGTSSLDRADRNGKTKAAGKGLERTTAEAGTPLAAMLPQIPASEVRNIAQIRIDPGRAEGTASLWGAHPPEDEAAGPLGLSSMVAAGRFASGGDGLTEGTQTAPGARPGETHPARPFESESAGSKGDAPDANGIEARQGSPDDKSGYGSIEIGASGGSEAAAAGRMNAEPGDENGAVRNHGRAVGCQSSCRRWDAAGSWRGARLTRRSTSGRRVKPGESRIEPRRLRFGAGNKTGPTTHRSWCGSDAARPDAIHGGAWRYIRLGS